MQPSKKGRKGSIISLNKNTSDEERKGKSSVKKAPKNRSPTLKKKEKEKHVQPSQPSKKDKLTAKERKEKSSEKRAPKDRSPILKKKDEEEVAQPSNEEGLLATPCLDDHPKIRK